jgi:hypothetical protein
MIAIVRKFLLPVLLVLASIVGGWQVTNLIIMIPSNMPYAVEMFIRYGLSVAGYEELANPDDMAVLALLLYWTVSAVVIGIVSYVAWSAIRGRFRQGSIPS